MSQEPSPKEREKKPVGADLVIPVAALIFTLYYFSTIVDSPWTARVSAYFIGTVLLVLIGFFVIQTVLQLRRGEANLGFDRLIDPMSLLPRRLALLALTVGFIFLVDYGGFTLTTFAFLALAMLVLSWGRRWRLIISLSAMLAIGGYLLFVVAFETRFPEGPFERLMEQMF